MQPALPQRREQVGLLHQGAAADVDQRRGRAHQRQRRRVDHPPGPPGQRHSEDEDVAAGQQLLPAHRGRHVVGGRGPTAQVAHRHAEAPCPSGDGPTDLAVADDAQRGAGHVVAEERCR